MTDDDDASSRSPWAFVPTLYFAEGLPYVVVNTVSVVLYKRMGVDNAALAFWTSWLYLPWVVKMFWGPLVELHATKRAWAVRTQLAMAVCLGGAALSLQTGLFFGLSLAAFFTAAFLSATHDMAVDGFYMLALSKPAQAFFVGVRSAFYRLAMITGTGLLVYLAGRLEGGGNIPMSWAMVLGLSAAMMGLLALYHWLLLPRPDADRSNRADDDEGGAFLAVMRSYFSQEGIGRIVAFIVLYRFGEAMLVKLAAPFLLDSPAVGGMGLSTSQVGIAYGTVGLVCLVLGGVAGGALIARYGFRRCIWPMALALNLPDLVYVYMAWVHPAWQVVYGLVAFEQFGYGVGFTAFTVYLMYVVREEYKTAHFAISTGIMALGMMLPGFVSGWLQQILGYKAFFAAVCLATIPGMLTIPFLPPVNDGK